MSEQNTNPEQSQASNVNIEELQSQINSLKANKDAALSEKKKLAEQNSQLQELINSVGGAEGIQHLIELKDKAKDEKQKELLAQGKVEEVIAQTTNQLKAQYESQLKAQKEQMEQLTNKTDDYRSKYREKLVLDKVLATSKRLELADTAYKDIALHVMHDFSFDENDNPVVVENGLKKVNEKGEIYGIDDYINDKRKEYSHWNKPVNTGFTKGALRGVTTNIDYSVMSKQQIMQERMARKFKK